MSDGMEYLAYGIAHAAGRQFTQYENEIAIYEHDINNLNRQNQNLTAENNRLHEENKQLNETITNLMWALAQEQVVSHGRKAVIDAFIQQHSHSPLVMKTGYFFENFIPEKNYNRIFCNAADRKAGELGFTHASQYRAIAR